MLQVIKNSRKHWTSSGVLKQPIGESGITSDVKSPVTMDVEMFLMLTSSMSTSKFTAISCISGGYVACKLLKYDCLRTEIEK